MCKSTQGLAHSLPPLNIQSVSKSRGQVRGDGIKYISFIPKQVDYPASIAGEEALMQTCLLRGRGLCLTEGFCLRKVSLLDSMLNLLAMMHMLIHTVLSAGPSLQAARLSRPQSHVCSSAAAAI